MSRPATSTTCVEADARARSRGRARGWRSREHRRRDRRPRVPDPRPRGGPLLHRARGRDAPAEFYLGFPPALVLDDAQGHRVRHRRDPARRLREDPGHAPARRRTSTCCFGRALGRKPRAAPAIERARRASTTPTTTTRAAARGARRRRSRAPSSPAARAVRRARVRRARDALGPTRTGASDLEAIAVIFAGPGTNLVFAIVLFRSSSWSAAAATTRVERGQPTAGRGGRARAATNRRDQRPSRSRRTDLARRIARPKGQPLTIAVARDGEPLMLGPVRAKQTG